MHTGKVIIKCDIEQGGQIVFKDQEIYFWADLEVSIGRDEDDYEVEDWSSDDVVSYIDDRLVMKEFGASKEFEAYMDELPYTDFTVLVKDTDYDDVEIDYGMFEPDWDMMREGK